MCEPMGSGRGPTAEKRTHREARTLVAGDEVTDEVTSDVYRMLSLIGEGGMGRVFKAVQVRTGEHVAVKCNQAIDPKNPALVERTRNEGKFLKGLKKHHHIVPVTATGLRDDGVFWMVMPLLDGASVEGLLAVLGRLPLVWALEIGRAVSSALTTVHEVALHRDIKPANVFVTRTGGIYVLDFGAGKFYSCGRLTTTGTSLGTIPYMSPEQLSDPDRMDGRSDLFSLGVMVFEMLAGVNPFDAAGPLQGNAITIGYRILNEEPHHLAALAPDLPGYVYTIVQGLLEKSVEHRVPSAQKAGEAFLAARREIQSRLGEAPPIERVFEAYDVLVREPPAGEGAPGPNRSGPRPKQGTIPLAGLGTVPLAARMPEARAPGALPAPPPPREPVAPAARAGGTVPMVVLPAASSDGAGRDGGPRAPGDPMEGAGAPLLSGEEAEIQRKLEAIDLLIADDTPETRSALLFALREYDDHPVVRSAATIALRYVGDETCLAALEERAQHDPQPLVRRMAEEAILVISRRIGRTVEVFAPLPQLAEVPDVPANQHRASPGAPAVWSPREYVLFAISVALVSAALVTAVLMWLRGWK